MMFPMPGGMGEIGGGFSGAKWERKPDAVSQDGLHFFPHHAMACGWSLRVPDENHGGWAMEYAEQAAQEVWDEVDRLESELSRFVGTSDIAQVNARAGSGEWTPLGASAWECLSWSVEVALQTGGAFDVALGQVLEDRRRADGTFAAAGEASEEEDWPGPMLKYLQLEAEPLRARLLHPRARLDLGAIGKGYALDSGAQILREWGVDNVLLHAGQSSVLALGNGPARHEQVLARGVQAPGWSVELRAPWDAEQSMGAVVLRDAALGGSGRELQGYHIVDPRTGLGAQGWNATWVLCPSFSALADALSTAFMVLGANDITQFCSERPQLGALAWREGESLALGTAFTELELDAPK
jgi:thiamine biosynthesis lipoprotein